ncbi:hypothetical protein F5X99DRAFT_369767 [Biscogniauxia marginata]|nr:hypothetical protein F5X99DRAFT_369767 [Biscogniauxia marginata]
MGFGAHVTFAGYINPLKFPGVLFLFLSSLSSQQIVYTIKSSIDIQHIIITSSSRAETTGHAYLNTSLSLNCIKYQLL